MTRANVRPEMLRWARERAGIDDAFALSRRFPKLAAWAAGDAQPTLRQLDEFARAMHVPVGYLLLSTPPDEPLQIPDFRTIGSHSSRRPLRIGSIRLNAGTADPATPRRAI